jgi:uncharacterized protein
VTREQIDEMVAGDRAGYRAREAAHVEAKLEKLERRIRVAAHAKAALTVSCGRCLSPTNVDVPVDFEITLVPSAEYDAASREAKKEGDKGPIGGSFDLGAAEEETYSGKVIDLDPILREQVALALPGYPVCQESCKGLCPVCGTNLNERECGCDRHVPDPRWAALEKLKRQ